MDQKRRVKRLLPISIIIVFTLLGVFLQGAWAQPSVVSMDPADWPGPDPNLRNISINTRISIQFNMSMNPGENWIGVRDEGHDEGVPGTLGLGTTTNPNDTLIFTPGNALKPANCYHFEGYGTSTAGRTWFNGTFVTKPSSADATPPTVQTVNPYPGKTGVSTGERIFIKFSEQMNLETINSTNITIIGLSASDYTVTYDPEDVGVEIRKHTPFLPFNTYTVTVTTNVKDLRGNWLKTAYPWSFTTGLSDIAAPTVQQTIPADGDLKVSPYARIHVIFSEDMDETTLNSSNITIENEIHVPVGIDIQDAFDDLLKMVPAGGAQFLGGHTYTVTIGTGVKDRAGNGLSAPYAWSFTVPSSGDTAPIIEGGTYLDDNWGIRSPGSITGVDLWVSAWDYETSPLTVTASTPGHSSWTLNEDYSDYLYSTGAGNEGLSNGSHRVDFSVTDGAISPNEVSFYRNIFIFDGSPALSSPTSGATGVLTTPTFTWSYSSITSRPFYYFVGVFDDPNPDTSRMLWVGYAVDKGSVPHTVTIPADKALAPNTTYYWGVMGSTKEGNGQTISGIFPFTTGGTLPPVPHFASPWRVGNDDLIDSPGPGIRGQIFVKVTGPSPADIVELKVTGPSGFQYIFTEGDLATSEKNGQYYGRLFESTLSAGTYTFSVTDFAGRTVTADREFTAISLPRVDYLTMTPADSAYVNTTTPSLSWGSVGAGYYYRVVIWDWNNAQSPVYSSDLTQDTQITMPPGYLLANTSYNWRVDVLDFPHGNNRTRSHALQFHTGDSSSTPALGGLSFYNDNNYYNGIGKSMSFLVRGILPDEITRLRVQGSNIDYDFLQTNVSGNINPGTTGNLYTYSEWEPVDAGDYTITLDATPRGTTSLTKNITPSTIPIVDQSSLSPANNAYLSTLTPLLEWSGVTGSPRYYRVLIQDWRNRYTVYASTPGTGLSFTIPAGILRPNRSYKWRVDVFDAETTSGTGASVADNRSATAWNCFTTPGHGRLTDFDGDWKTDILWRHTATGTVAVWLMNGGAISSIGVSGAIPSDWEIKGNGDFNDDGKTDILWQHPATGTVAIWFMNGAAVSSIAVPGAIPPDWQIKGVRDFDGDGKSDVLWQHPATGTVAIWFMDGAAISSIAVPGAIPPDWQIKGVRDFNGDGRADILWQHPASGTVAIWLMHGGTIVSILVPGAIAADWQIKGIGDFNSDGRGDILWQHTATGTVAIWFMDGGMITSIAVPGTIPSDWQIKAMGDFGDDGYGDIVWQHPTTGTVALWFMNGGTISSIVVPGAIPADWQIMN